MDVKQPEKLIEHALALIQKMAREDTDPTTAIRVIELLRQFELELLVLLVKLLVNQQGALDGRRQELPERGPELTDSERGQHPGGVSSATTPSPPPTNAALPPSRRKAYQQYLWATRTSPELAEATDRDVYRWLSEHVDDGEQLPAFGTWSRYLREARVFYGTSKHNRRSGRGTGRSVVRRGEI